MASSWIQEAEENAKKYAQALKEQSQYLIDQQNQAKQNTLSAIENQRQDAINTLTASKDTVRQTAEDNAKQANINRMLALKDNQNAMSRAGLSTQGIVGSQVNSINNNYGNDLNSILQDRANQLKAIDDQVNSTNLQYDTNRINAINQYDQNIADLNSQIDANALNQYNTIYQSTLAQKQQDLQNELAELQRQEAIRQFNLQMEYQKQQDAIQNAQTWSQINSNNKNYTFDDGNNNAPSSTQIKTDYYSGNINPDVKYGTFKTTDKNGVQYQPNNVGGKKLHSSTLKVKDLFTGATGSTGASLDNQTIWSTGSKWYVWDGSQNSYQDITTKVSKALLQNPSLASKIK